MVGGERNEMTKVMIGQTQVQSLYSGASTKYRLVLLEVEKLRTGFAAATPDKGQALYGARLVELFEDYAKERALTKKWAESYEPIIAAHFEATEFYEHSQLVAEVGIVVASLAVLLMSQAAWGVAVALACATVLTVGGTYFHTKHVVHVLEENMEVAQGAYTELRKLHAGAHDDEDAIAALRTALHISPKAVAEPGAKETPHLPAHH